MKFVCFILTRAEGEVKSKEKKISLFLSANIFNETKQNKIGKVEMRKHQMSVLPLFSWWFKVKHFLMKFFCYIYIFCSVFPERFRKLNKENTFHSCFVFVFFFIFLTFYLSTLSFFSLPNWLKITVERLKWKNHLS